MWRRRWVRWPAELLLVLAVVFAANAYRSRDAAQGPAPDFQARTLAGEPVSLARFAGRPVLVHFWATWCPVCRLEQDAIDALAADHAVITVALQSDRDDAVRAYLREHQLSFAVVNDPYGELAHRYGVRGVPTSFVVDGGGRIRFVETGYTTSWGLRLRLWWAGL